MSYRARRAELHQSLGSDEGVILLLGSNIQPRNYVANGYRPFRQNSHFLYYTGLQQPDLAMLSYPDGKEILFGRPADIDSVVWEGEQPSLEDYARSAEIAQTRPISELQVSIRHICDALLYLPPFQADMLLQMCALLDRDVADVKAGVSEALMFAVSEQRSIKSAEEIAEIELALGLTAEMFHEAMQMTKPDLPISKLLGHFYQRVRDRLWDFSFSPIITTHGEILHSTGYEGKLESGKLLLVDMGVETSKSYASDITRTWPVDGVFSSRQKDIYEIALQMQAAAFEAIRPGVSYRDVHLRAARACVCGLKDIGLMRGDIDQAVENGAFALFFPHGLGHTLGLDVHDMEDLGDVVGYERGTRRDTQFGLNFLRLARTLREGFVLTVEPGIYFSPTLIELWRNEARHVDLINYAALDDYLSFGGIRIEDDVLVTTDGMRILGPHIDRTIDQIESRIAK
jgi:Xaa-Pro aminopeptidase